MIKYYTNYIDVWGLCGLTLWDDLIPTKARFRYVASTDLTLIPIANHPFPFRLSHDSTLLDTQTGTQSLVSLFARFLCSNNSAVTPLFYWSYPPPLHLYAQRLSLWPIQAAQGNTLLTNLIALYL